MTSRRRAGRWRPWLLPGLDGGGCHAVVKAAVGCYAVVKAVVAAGGGESGRGCYAVVKAAKMIALSRSTISSLGSRTSTLSR
jgi:hypothetical protein